MEANFASMISTHPDSSSSPTCPVPSSARIFNTSATNRQSPTFDSSSSFLSPDTANTVGHLSDTAATPTQWRVILKASRSSYFCPNPNHECNHLGQGRFTRPSCGARLPHTIYINQAQVIPSAEHHLFWRISPLQQPCIPLVPLRCPCRT
jgi:hypothetical protein